jgi:hypothetical protein
MHTLGGKHGIRCYNKDSSSNSSAMPHTHTRMDAHGIRWRALAGYLIKHMAKRQQLLAAIVDGI